MKTATVAQLAEQALKTYLNMNTTMPTRINDFAMLLNAPEYKDLPVALGHIEVVKRADWTTHIPSTVQEVSSLTGLFSCFKSGGRTAAEIKFANKNVWAKLEWEWDQPKEQSSPLLLKIHVVGHPISSIAAFPACSHLSEESSLGHGYTSTPTGT